MRYERIRNLREDRDLTQSAIAEYLNIAQRTYSHYENDERAIPLELLSRLADFYQTSVDYLIGRTNVKKPYPKPSE
ncbi:MAG: helix-turn-helix domain-containing protein [Muribaculaceae bacterium]|nr:helix-turn-helix domain-containing protein [Roseburia sp.]MCM1431585.1 helix-turn-helix domain-containing protein [Muribaculaceae bacterium]MCM1492050.1 helix-turn-helix domain-containing protein [Muribaculaceae bacterium]